MRRTPKRAQRNKHAQAKDEKYREEKENIPYTLEERTINGQKVTVKVYPKPFIPDSYYELPVKPPWIY